MSPRLWALLLFAVLLAVSGCSDGAVTAASGNGAVAATSRLAPASAIAAPARRAAPG